MEHGRMKVFDYDTPDVPVARAATASGSLPILFKPKEIDGVKYADGGWIDNIPTPDMIEIYKSKEYRDGKKIEDILKEQSGATEQGNSQTPDADRKQKTLLLAFGKEDEKSCQSFQALYSHKDPHVSRGLVERIVVWLASWKIKGKESYDDHDKRTYRIMQKDYALRTVRLSTDLGTADFNKATTKSKQLLLEGYFHQQDYLINYDFTEEKQGYKHAKFFFEAFKNFEKSERWYHDTSDHNRAPKAAKLFSMAEPKQYETMSNAQLEEKLTEYMSIACVNRKSSAVSANNRSVEAFIKTLNDPYTPEQITKSCANILKIQTPDIKNHKFTKEDFKNFISENKDKLLSAAKEERSPNVKRVSGVKHTEKIEKRGVSHAKAYQKEVLVSAGKPKGVS